MYCTHETKQIRHAGTLDRRSFCPSAAFSWKAGLTLSYAITITVLISLLGVAKALADEAAKTDTVIKTEKVSVRVETVATGLEHPWGLAFLPDGRFLVTERNSGQLRIGVFGGKLSEPVDGVPDVFRYEGPTDRSQAGLFDVLVHPRFEENQFVYLSFSQPSEEGAGTAIARGRLVSDDKGARLEDVKTIFTMNKHDSSGLHFGGRMAIDPRDNTIYLSIGDRRNISRAQDPEDHAGSIIRVRDDGQVPPDNPFVKEEDHNDKIFSYGHRNIQGLAIHPKSAELWANGHGPLGGDVIHRIQAGGNYGWPFVTGGVDYSGAPIGVGTEREGMISAIHIFEATVAPSGLIFYDGDMFPEWHGDLLHGGLVARAVVRTRLEGEKVIEEEWMLRDVNRRIRDVRVHADGSIWLLTEHEDGEVLRIARAEARPAIAGG